LATRLIIGCGYLGTPVAKHWIAQGDQVFALTRSHDNAQRLRTLGIQPLLGDVMEPQSLPIFPAVEQVLYAVGYDRSGKYSLEDVYVQGLKNVVHRLPDSVQQLVYISSTGVYGQDDGSWVTETSETVPTRPGGKACLEAELFLLDKQAQAALPRVTILRLAGIYGPNRIPRLAQIKQGQHLKVPSTGWLNLIHVQDAVRVVDCVISQQPSEHLYLVSDGHPVVRHEYLQEIARQLGAPPVVFEDTQADSAVAQRAGSSKRICNQRLMDEFQLQWKYPTYRETLTELLAKA